MIDLTDFILQSSRGVGSLKSMNETAQNNEAGAAIVLPLFTYVGLLIIFIGFLA